MLSLSMGIDFQGIDEFDGDPPDPTLAAGLDSLVAMVNHEIVLFSKAGEVLASEHFDEFFPNKILNYNTFDPWATYDRYSGRFIVMAVEPERGPGGDEAYLHIAVSTDSSPDDLNNAATGGDWHIYAIPATQTLQDPKTLEWHDTWPDYPKLAADADSIYISGSYTQFEGGLFLGVVITRLEKAPMLEGTLGERSDINVLDDGQPLAPPADDPGRGVVLQPMLGVGRAADAPQLFAERLPSDIRIWELDDQNNLTSPTVDVPDNSPIIWVEQPGSVRLKSLSPVLLNAVWRDDSLWTAHTVKVGEDAAVRWYEIKTDGGYSLNQTGDINPGEGIQAFMSAVAVDSLGNMGITYSQSP